MLQRFLYCVCYWLFASLSCYKNVKFERWKWNWLIRNFFLFYLLSQPWPQHVLWRQCLWRYKNFYKKQKNVNDKQVIARFLVQYGHIFLVQRFSGFYFPQKIFELGKYCSYRSLYREITSTYCYLTSFFFCKKNVFYSKNIQYI